jgi:selenocysteine lyase/cysteine desulfurase
VPVLGSLQAARTLFGDHLSRLALSDYTSATFQNLRSEYLLDPGITYLNHASIGTIPRVVHDARVRYLELCETNPWLYMWGGAWEQPREEVRRKSADLLGCASNEVTITHNTTEAFSLLANGLPLGPGDEVVFSSLNHDGASVAWYHFASSRGFTVKPFDFPVGDIPTMTTADVLDAHDRHITPRTRVLVFPHVDNIVGLRHPARELAELAHSKGVEFVAVDAAQTVGMLPVDVQRMGVDIYAASPHKWLQAPKGIGLMYVRREVQESLRALWVTWGQERWKGTSRIFEDYGTRNLAEVITMGDAIDFQNRLNQQEREHRLRALWQHAQNVVRETARAVWRSPTSWELAASLYAVEIEGTRSNELFDDMYGNHGFVFRAFGTERFNHSRLSPNVFTTEDELSRFFEIAARE